MRCDYDMIVIGGGAAGLTAAGMAAVFGAKTALIEARKLGGDCTWHGCIPSKSLVRAAKVAHEMRNAERYGLTAARVEHDFSKVMARVHSIREHVYKEADAPPNFEKLGVEVIEGRARFLDPHAIEVGWNGAVRKLSSRRFIVATGSSPRIPAFRGLEAAPVVNNETVFELDRLPRRLLVLGAGPIGIEMAQAFRRLGSDVTVINTSSGILKRDDPELTAILLESLQREGIRFLFGTELVRFEGGAAYTKSGERLETDTILAAVGRKPNLDSLNLKAAGVWTNDKGVIVDSRCRSSAKHIYACGDVAGRYLFTHFAEHMAKVAITNAILHVPARLDERHITWSTFSDPELAHVGRSEQELKRDNVKYSVLQLSVYAVGSSHNGLRDHGSREGAREPLGQDFRRFHSGSTRRRDDRRIRAGHAERRKVGQGVGHNPSVPDLRSRQPPRRGPLHDGEAPSVDGPFAPAPVRIARRYARREGSQGRDVNLKKETAWRNSPTSNWAIRSS